jgi:hypothetical protein
MWAAAATLPLVFGASTLGLFHTIDMGRNVDTAAEQDAVVHASLPARLRDGPSCTG